MPKIDTFSAHSLKILDKSLDEFINKFEYNLNIFKKDERAIIGSKYHNLICAYIKNFDISKMLLELNENQKNIFNNFLNQIKNEKNNFIKTEFPFLIKDELNNIPYFLTGRMDAIYKKNDEYIIYDWKTLNLPKDAQNDLQSIVYLYSLSKIFNSEKIKMRYVSIEKGDFLDVNFLNEKLYKTKIDSIIEKYYYI